MDPPLNQIWSFFHSLGHFFGPSYHFKSSLLLDWWPSYFSLEEGFLFLGPVEQFLHWQLFPAHLAKNERDGFWRGSWVIVCSAEGTSLVVCRCCFLGSLLQDIYLRLSLLSLNLASLPSSHRPVLIESLFALSPVFSYIQYHQPCIALGQVSHLGLCSSGL